MSRESLSKFKPGDQIEKGQELGQIGNSSENGGWPSHLHFQIVLNLFGNTVDYPGVAFPDNSEVYLCNSPNPRPFFSLNTQTFYSSDTDKIKKDRTQHLGKNLSVSYQKPLHIVRGFKQYLFDSRGQRYLDTVNNVAHVGHEHPRVVSAACRQLSILNTNTRYLHPQITDFATELLNTFPSELSVVFFVNSGSEANELALRLTESYTGSKEMIVVEHGYHGNTSSCVNISSYKFDGKGGRGAPETTHVIPSPDPFRGLYRDQPNIESLYGSHVDTHIDNLSAQGKQVGGFICESILSCGGQIVLPPNYLSHIYAQIRAAGALCIADEVQVGFGRVGESFWGFELQGVVPDIVTVGKPIGNGHPLAAVITTRAIADKFANGMEYFNTFGGNPVSCAIGREVLQIIHDEKLQENAFQVGQYLFDGMRFLQEVFPLIGDVRGYGFFLGVELIDDMDLLTPASAKASYLVNRMRERGILMSVDGPDENVIKIKPPMCYNKANADHLLANLKLVLNESFMQI